MSDVYSFTVTSAGAQPTPPATLLAQLIANVAATNPGYTATLPGSLIEDLSSTEVFALAVCDSGAVETINSLSPFTANPFILSQLGQIYIGAGSAPAVPTNTSVYVIFNGPPGFVVPIGFTVGDGTYQYVVQDGGVVAASGYTAELFCEATIPGTWAVPTNTVNQLVTSVPDDANGNPIVLTCTNPVPGVSGAVTETEEQYRARVMQAGQAVSTGTASTLKTLLGNVPGVQQRLISVVQQPNGFWEIICGGGDPYQTAYAIYNSGLNVAGLVGSTLNVTNITNANGIAGGQVTTDKNHGYTTGQVAEITGVVGMTAINGVPFTVTVVDEKNFTTGINTTSYPAYVSGGVVTPNLRNETPNLYDAPDTYSVPFVDPPQQSVTMTVTWDTTALNFVSQAAVAQLAAPALANYVNNIVVGQPMNLGVMNATFAAAVSSVLDPATISELIFAVSINGVSTPAEGGTQLIYGDVELFFETSAAVIGVVQA